ncbi:MAG: hypothetical protein KGI75_28145 [Rhizobiaceae bacterium]|nr:hypothetical protein [Rhizobiaceae bacterium]
MSDLKTALDAAAGEGIISRDQASRLLPYLTERNIDMGPAQARGDLSQPRDLDPPNPLEDSEAPRFIRGFHDVLITIGIVVLLVGLWGLTGYFGPIVAILVLAEILVRRQRLALPAVVLTVALAHWIFTVCTLYLGGVDDGRSVMVDWMLMALPLPIVFAIYYWRYRVPLSLAMLLLSLFALLLATIFYVIGKVTDVPDVVFTYPTLSFSILVAAALGTFAVAMRFDLTDRERVTRRSDVAFWLHLATAPALLYSTILLVLQVKAGNGIASVSAGFDYSDALIIMAIVLVMMMIGVVIDRRAFVTSGLVSLGVAIGGLLRQNQAGFDKIGFTTLLIVGAVVLVIGIGWPYLRRAAIGLLPASLQMRLPVLR